MCSQGNHELDNVYAGVSGLSVSFVCVLETIRRFVEDRTTVMQDRSSQSKQGPLNMMLLNEHRLKL